MDKPDQKEQPDPENYAENSVVAHTNCSRLGLLYDGGLVILPLASNVLVTISTADWRRDCTSVRLSAFSRAILGFVVRAHGVERHLLGDSPAEVKPQRACQVADADDGVGQFHFDH